VIHLNWRRWKHQILTHLCSLNAGTFHCSWNSSACYFATGVGGREVEDSVYGVNRETGIISFKHVAPVGVFFDNLVFDYAHENLYYVSFNSQTRDSFVVKLDAASGNLTYIFAITKDIGTGVIFPGQVSICSELQRLYVGVDAPPELNDFVLEYDVSGKTPKLIATTPLLFPIPTSTHAFCNATALESLIANTIQVDGFDRETALLGDVVQAGKEGLFFPIANGDLPAFNRRGGAAPKYFNGMMAEFAGDFVLPAYEPYEVGPGPFKRPEGLVWNVKLTGGPAIETLTPLGYFLAGASGVPGQ
jgi:hypothetical protein